VLINSQGHSDLITLNTKGCDLSKLTPKGLSELDRLSCVIAQIDRGCSIVPVGAYFKNNLGEI